MLFRCQNCGTEFKADSRKVPNPNVKFRCIKCKVGFLVHVREKGEASDAATAGKTAQTAARTSSTAAPAGPAQARLTLTKVKDLPSLPFVATKVMELTSSPNTTMKQMEEVILKDPALATKVLRYSNSALYGRAGQISSLTDALVLLGFSTVKTIVIASSVKSMHSSRSQGYLAAGKNMWVHSVETAIAARLFARLVDKKQMEETFVAGLLHDIGKSIIESRLPGTGQQMMSLLKDSDETLEEIERKTLGIAHSELGAVVCKKWNFPELLEKAILYHHDPSKSKKDSNLAHIVALADAISYHLALNPAERQDDATRVQEMPSCNILGIDSKSLAWVIEETQTAVERDKKIFDM